MDISTLGEATLGGDTVVEAKFDNFGRFLAVLTSSKLCIVFDISNGSFTEIVRTQLDSSAQSIAWTHPKFGHHVVVSLASGSVHVLKLTVVPRMSTLSLIGEAKILSELPSALNVGNTDYDMLVALGSVGGKIGILSLKTNELLSVFEAHFGGVTGLSFDTNCNNLFSVGQDSRLVKWTKKENLNKWNKTLSIKSEKPLTSLDYSSGELIVSHTSKIFVYNTAGELLDTLDIHLLKQENGLDLTGESVTKVAFHSYQSIAVSLNPNLTLVYTKHDDGKYKFASKIQK